MLVPAVLRPEQREDRELEVRGLAPVKRHDPLVLLVGQPEGPVERLFGDRRQVVQCSRGVGSYGCGVVRRFALPLVLLGALWGASYLFIRVAVRDLEPTTMVCLRLLLSAPFLFAFLVVRAGGVGRAWREVRAAWLPSLVLGLGNAAIPYVLIGWGEKHVDSGAAAIANST